MPTTSAPIQTHYTANSLAQQASSDRPTSISGLFVGQRIAQETYIGTIRYIGPVGETRGEWIGVEWDDESRGKHSGTHGGTHYFDCIVEGAGSFTRFSTNKIKIGTTFLEELRERYAPNPEDEVVEEDVYIDDKLVEKFDFQRIKDRQRNLHMLRNVGLGSANVSRAGDKNEIGQTCSNIQDLDMTSSLIPEWQIVADICEGLKHLSVLRLNRNRFTQLTAQPDFSACFRNLICLTLDRTLISWDEIELLEPSLPVLEVLQMAFNRISTLGSTLDNNNNNNNNMETDEELAKVRGFANLKDLHFETNNISDWRQVMRLSRLPNLESLHLVNNKIQSINVVLDQDHDFKKLHTIRLNGNQFIDWKSVDRLGEYSALKTLWIGTEPVLEQQLPVEEQDPESRFDARTTLISRMPGLRHLDGADITASNRLDAELYYIRMVALTSVKFKYHQEKINELHPQYARLCEVHGAPDMSAESRKATSDIMKDRLLAIRIKAYTPPSKLSSTKPTSAAVERKVLGTMTVRSLKNLVQKLVKIPAMKQELFFMAPMVEQPDKIVEVILNDDLRQLSYYDVQDNVEILVRNSSK